MNKDKSITALEKEKENANDAAIHFELMHMFTAALDDD